MIFLFLHSSSKIKCIPKLCSRLRKPHTGHGLAAGRCHRARFFKRLFVTLFTESVCLRAGRGIQDDPLFVKTEKISRILELPIEVPPSAFLATSSHRLRLPLHNKFISGVLLKCCKLTRVLMFYMPFRCIPVEALNN